MNVSKSYPSGRLAVLCLRSSFSTTLFFDDKDSVEDQFLGFVTSTGNVLIMQPKFHAQFITNNQSECCYLCNGKTGIIEKQFQCNFKTNYQRPSISNDKNNSNSESYENTVQFQLNSFMQLEYHNPSNICFAFICQNERFQFQLGTDLPRKASILMDSIQLRSSMKNNTGEKTIQTETKRSHSITSNDISNSTEKQQIQPQKLLDEQSNFHYLPIFEELLELRQHIRNICDSWLKEYRTMLGKIFTINKIYIYI